MYVSACSAAKVEHGLVEKKEQSLVWAQPLKVDVKIQSELAPLLVQILQPANVSNFVEDPIDIYLNTLILHVQRHPEVQRDFRKKSHKLDLLHVQHKLLKKVCCTS